MTMKNALLALCAASVCTLWAISASQEWVSNYVANAIGSSAAERRAQAAAGMSNGFVVVSVGGVTLAYEDPTDAALMATNALPQAVSAGITNGTLFVWSGAADWIGTAGAITATRTNFVWHSVGSVPASGLDSFPGWFSVRGVLVPPSVSHAVTNGVEVAR